MKKLFELFGPELTSFLMSVRDEIVEEYYFEEGCTPPTPEEHDAAVALLVRAHKYVLNLRESQQSINKLLQVLELVADGESGFLKDGEDSLESMLRPHSYHDRGRRPRRKVQPQEAAGLATQYLRYLLYYLPISDRGSVYQLERMCDCITEHAGKAGSPEMAGSGKLDRKFPIRQKGYFDRYMVGQENLKETLAMEVYHFLKTKESREAVLLVGDTGSGKNHSIQVLRQWFRSEKIPVPVIEYDASRLTPAGFTGDSVSDVVKEIKSAMRGAGSELAIVYLDEICKIIHPNYDSQGENVNGLVQGQLLTLISGDEIDGLDMTKVLFILGGAFAELHAARETRQKTRAPGFIRGNETGVKEEKPTIREELHEASMTREFLGRIGTIVELDTPDKGMLKSILTHPEIGPIAKKKKLYALDDLELSIDEDVVDEIVEQALAQNLGARSANNKITEVLGTYNYAMLDHGFSKIRIHRGVLHGEEPYYEGTERTTHM